MKPTPENKSLCVFCGARDTVEADFLDQARSLGNLMAQKNIRLIYGGGDCGMMGATANSVLKSGGKVTGVFPKFLNQYESEHKSLSEMIIVEDMHTRKWTMFEHCDAIAVLPGGFGTMDETFEVLTWKQLGLHKKPIVIYNYRGYWDPFLRLVDNIISLGFASPATRELFTVASRLEDVISLAFPPTPKP